MALADEIVRLHHGSIRVSSALGKGSTFTVTIPVDGGIEAMLAIPG